MVPARLIATALAGRDFFWAAEAVGMLARAVKTRFLKQGSRKAGRARYGPGSTCCAPGLKASLGHSVTIPRARKQIILLLFSQLAAFLIVKPFARRYD